MRRWTIARAFVAVGVLAVGLAALKQATDFWHRMTFSLTVLALLVGILGAIVRARPAGAWVGFALFGGVYFALAIVPIGHAKELWTAFLTDDLGRAVAERIHPQPVRPTSIPAGAELGEVRALAAQDEIRNGSAGQAVTYLDQLESYNSRVDVSRRIFHLLSCLILGALGALLGQILAARREPDGPPARGTDG